VPEERARLEWNKLSARPEPEFVNLLCSPGIDSKESIPPAYVAWQAGTSNRVVVPSPARLGIDSWAAQKVYKFGL